MKQFSRKYKQGGFSLIELFVVLGVIAIMVAVVGPRIYRVFVKSDIATEATNLRDVVASLQSFRDGGGLGASGTNLVPLLVNTESVPAGWTMVSGVPYHAWKGTVAISSNGLAPVITYNGVPKSECIEFAAKVSAADLSTKVNAASAVTGKLSQVQTDAACNAASNTLTFTVVR